MNRYGRNPDGLRGEWWIDDGGGSIFADGDIGDQNHEGVAYWAALGIDPEEPTEYRARQLKNNWDEVEELKKKYPDDEDVQAADAYDIAKALEELYPGGGMHPLTVIGLLVIGAEPKAVEYFISHMADAREYMMEHEGWIRVQNNNFQMWVFNDDALSNIKSFLGDEYPEDEVLEDDEFNIEELSTGKYFSLSGEAIMNSNKTAGELKFSAVKLNPPMDAKGYHPPGSRLYFEYHCWESPESSDAELWYHSHQRVTILRLSEPGLGDTKMERCDDGAPAVYEVRFDDGYVWEATEDELYTNKRQFFRPDPPQKPGTRN